MSDPTIPTCPVCGLMAGPGESFCRKCGKPLLPPTIVSRPSAVPRPPIPPQSTVTAVSPMAAAAQQSPPINVGRKKRSPFLLGCLVFLGLIFIVAAGSGIYIWRRVSYTAPDRKAPAIPQRAAGTLTEFPVDNDPSNPARPTSVQTEALGGSTASNDSSSPTKLPPGINRTSLAKGATSMTSTTYRGQHKSGNGASTTASTKDNVYICVLTAMPNQPNFGDGLASLVVRETGGNKTGVRIQSPAGAVYVGSKIRSPEANVYVLTKQGGDIVILLYSDDPANQAMVDRLAQSVGNGQGLMDYPEVKNSLWTLPASTPIGLTLVEVNTVTGDQIENSIAGATGNDDVQKILSQMRPFIPARLTGARYLDASRQEWITMQFEYESSFQAWRTWLLARSALGIGGAQSVNVRDVNGVYLEQEGKRILVFQKGPYLIFLGSPSSGTVDRMLELGNLFQV